MREGFPLLERNICESTTSLGFPMNDATLARRIQRGDTQAWELFFDSTAPIVYRYVVDRLDGRADLVEDVVQETYFRALDRIEQFDVSRGALGQWLLGIARNHVNDQFRRASRSPGSARPELLRTLDQQPLPDEAAERAELRAQVRMALERLSPSHHRVLLAKYERSLSLDEIAAQENRTRKAVESLLRRARQGLRRALSKISNIEGA